uniref:Uncharacterized protein n=1 Tax=Magallana gigas TaxID=29159 RepID=K1RNL6_MAGGI
MSIKDSKTIQENRTQKENMGKIKVKPHHGRFESYNFDRKELLDGIRKIPEGSIVNWTEKARKFNLTINGKFPLNGVFLTDDEYANLHPGRKTGSIQSMVERPCLYILGQSPSTDADQPSYINTRLKDLSNCKTTATSQGILLRNKIRVFSGDGPARQFEAGQQRGGNYTCICGIYAKDHNNLECCLRREPISLEDRRLLMTGGIMWRKFENGVINPFASLTKDELIDELEARNVDTYLLKKPELQEQLNNILHGIQRPPALMTDDLSKSASTLGIPDHEVLGCEPLHDITNIVQNIITELPYHIESKDVQKDLKIFISTQFQKKIK